MKSSTTSILNPAIYDQDYYLWIQEQVRLLGSGQFQDLDWVNLMGELEDMGKREKRSVRSNLVVVLMHLLKYQFQPERRSNSWLATLIEHRLRLRDDFQDSPSLKTYVADPTILKRCYEDACDRASRETGLPKTNFPENCPYHFDQILDKDFLPE